MPKILYYKGAPASGKSVEARKLVKQGYVRVNKDELRALLHNGAHTQAKEALVLAIQDAAIEEALKVGRNVVVDNTGFHPDHEKRIRRIAAKYNADFDVVFFDTDKATCLKRNQARSKKMAECPTCAEKYTDVPDEAIEFMFKRYINNSRYKMEHPLTVEEYIDEILYQHQDGLPWAIMVDMDGTLAHMCKRSPYEWQKCIDDTVNAVVADIVSRYATEHCLDLDPMYVIVMSGRDEICRPETKQWLEREEVKYDFLFMRKENDNRKDSIVKKELFDANVRGKFNIAFVLDDRKQVVDMWRDIGLTCLQVAPGDF